MADLRHVTGARSPPHSFSSIVNSTSMNDSASIFKDGKLEPGVFKIQNIVSQTYLDVREHTRELCCRPATHLDGKGLVGSRSNLAHTITVTVTPVGNPSFGFWIHDTKGRAFDHRLSLPRVLSRTVQLESDGPEQFCIILGAPGCFISVASFPVAWRIEKVRDGRYPGCEYVRWALE